MGKKTPWALVWGAVLWAAGLASCGLEEYYYLPQVPPDHILSVEMNNRATIRLPNNSGYYYFNNFKIFYKIYISKENTAGVIQASDTELDKINAYLRTDFNAIYPSTDITNSSQNTAVASLFRNRGYREIAVQGADINGLLSSSTDIVLDFPATTGVLPTLTLGGPSSYTLYRSDGEGAFTPEPDRQFLNSSDLNASANAISTKNADVADDTRISSGAPRYAYVSLYIVAVGWDDRNFVPIYSKPTFIGILKLPESS